MRMLSGAAVPVKTGIQAPEPFGALPSLIVERLHAEGVHSLDDWRALGSKRFQLFGITGRIALQIDKLAEVAP